MSLAENRTGINRLLKIQQDQQARQQIRTRTDLQSRLFGVIRSIPGKSIADHNTFCGRLVNMTIAEQRQAIMDEYGSVCLEKAEPLLYQISTIK